VASFLIRRLLASAVLLVIVLSTTFFVLHLAPGDPSAVLDNPRVPQAQRQALRERWGLDRPLAVQYIRWLASVARGHWGTSFLHQRPVGAVILDALPNTLILGAAAALVQLTCGLALGVLAARRAGTATDHLVRGGTLLLYSLPTFWLGLMAILLLSLHWPLFPPSHMRSVGAELWSAAPRLLDLLRHLALPALVLGVATAGGVTRFVRGSLLEVLYQDFVRTARAKGLRESRVFYVHALRSAAAPVLQIAGLQLPALLSGSLVTEVVFAWPGMGRLAHSALLGRDYPLVLACTALGGVLVIAGNLLADLLHAAADPRVRHGQG
jgi:peptide/nickel transport system permease protein